MRKGKPRDPRKEQFWRDILERWQRSGLSVRQFCRQQRLAEPSFHAWKRTLARRDQALQPPASSPAAVTFLPLQIRPDAPTDQPAVELLLANGRRLRIPAGCALDHLHDLLALLEESSC